ncbi:MAG: efflux RND transporter permease subunit [Proteobacteria bacterium]|nr:efflux RND transporter permease subunit [Pseudomonadota bacterium]
MFLSNMSIKQPVLTTMMMVALVVLGYFGYRRLNVDQFPDVDLPVVSVGTRWPGAGAESVESEVTKPIEEAVHTLSGVKEVRSTSSEGVSTVTISFELDRDGREAANDVRDKVAALAGVLPEAAEAPLIQRFDPSAAPIASLGLASKTLSTRDLTDLADRVVKKRLVNVAGVGAVKIVGGARRQISVSLRPDDLRARGVTAASVVDRLRQENADVPAGRVSAARTETVVRVAARINRVADFATLVIGRGHDDAPIYLRDVADLEDGQEELRSLALIGTSRTVTLEVQKQSGANTVAVVHEIQRRLPELQEELGARATLSVVRNGAKMIEESVDDVKLTLVLGAILTVLVVFLFLNSWRSTVITGLTLPVSVIGAFLVVWAMGFTLNILTLMALSLAIGLLIDDAIVVRENIVRHAEMGKSHHDAARDGTAEIGMAVIATTLAIVAVFVPVAFMKGIIGRFFYQFGITVACAVLISLFVSFTLDPMMSSVWPDPHGVKRGPIGRALERFSKAFDRLSLRYHGTVLWALDHRKTTLAIAAASFVATLALAGRVGGAFMPDYDKGEFQVDFRTPVGASIEYTEEKAKALVAIVIADPDVELAFTTIGAGATGAVNEGSIYVRDRKHGRKRTTNQIRRDLREQLRDVIDVRYSLSDVGGAGGAQQPIQLSLRGPDLALLDRRAHHLLEEARKIPGLVDAKIAQERTKPELRILLDRDRATDRGVSARAVGSTVQTLLGGEVATELEDARGERYDVRVQLAERSRTGKADLATLELPSTKAGVDGRRLLVPLGQIARIEDSLGPSQIERLELERQVTISAGVEGRALGDVTAELDKRIAALPRIEGYSETMGGQTRDMIESAGYALESLILAVIFIYLILASQFGSFLQPLAIMLSLPLSFIGVVGALLLTNDTLNIMTMIGLIMLMGLVVKNAILLIDNANQRRREGMPRTDALAKAGEIRLRPIIMTTLAMIVGMVPLALAIGEGAEMRAPMARAVIGGLISSTFLTLLVVPVVYAYLDDFGAWVGRKWSSEDPLPAEDGVP